MRLADEISKRYFIPTCVYVDKLMKRSDELLLDESFFINPCGIRHIKADC